MANEELTCSTRVCAALHVNTVFGAPSCLDHRTIMLGPQYQPRPWFYTDSNTALSDSNTALSDRQMKETPPCSAPLHSFRRIQC